MSLDETGLPTLNILKLLKLNKICFWILTMKIWTAFAMIKEVIGNATLYCGDSNEILDIVDAQRRT